MELLDMVTVLLGIGLGLLWPYVKLQLGIMEDRIMKEIDSQIEDVSSELKDALVDVGDSIKDVGNFDPEDQFQMLKLNLFQHFSNLAVDFIGKKLGGTMGVHQIEGPPSGESDTLAADAVVYDE